MKKLAQYISFIELALAVLVIFSMFLPFFKCVGNSQNAFQAIIGMKYLSTSLTTFSFMAMIPYILIFVLLVLIIVFDTKKNLVSSIVKCIFFIVIAILFFIYIRLLAPSNAFTLEEIIDHKFITTQIGTIISGIICIIGAGVTGLEIYLNLRKNK